MQIAITRNQKTNSFLENTPWKVTFMMRRHSSALCCWGRYSQGKLNVVAVYFTWTRVHEGHQASSVQVSRFKLCWSNLQRNQRKHPRNLQPFCFITSCYVEATRVD